MIFLSRRFLIIALVFITCIAGSASAANRLRADEVRALQEIGKTLGMHWDFSTDPCGGGGEWGKPYNPKGTEYKVSCNCSVSPNDNSCHITHIVIKEQDLQGTLPRALVKLPYLQEIDLSRNYLSGTIPPEWGTLPFVQISLLGNRLTGSIPKELGNISTLTSLVLEVNQFSGSLPLELGNLKNLERLLLNSNKFSEQLPWTLGKLTALKDFRIADNNFTGKIPDFIQNWPSLVRLVIQASGLEGPIPLSISDLRNLTDLRISDLGGAEETFPLLSSIPNFEVLLLLELVQGPLMLIMLIM